MGETCAASALASTTLTFSRILSAFALADDEPACAVKSAVTSVSALIVKVHFLEFLESTVQPVHDTEPPSDGTAIRITLLPSLTSFEQVVKVPPHLMPVELVTFPIPDGVTVRVKVSSASKVAAIV